ncbi:hypothetical protein [Streptomyces sp. NPDC046976]
MGGHAEPVHDRQEALPVLGDLVGDAFQDRGTDTTPVTVGQAP